MGKTVRSFFFLTLSAAVFTLGCSEAELVNPDKSQWLKPGVSNVFPSKGPITGGTTLTIYGQGFQTGATVKVSGANCENVNVESLVKLTCVTPESFLAGSGLGQAAIEITNPNGKSGESAFTYVHAVSVVSNGAVVVGGVTASNSEFTISSTSGEPTANPAFQSTSEYQLLVGSQGILYTPGDN